MGERRKQPLTREAALNLLGTTENDFKTVGASIEDMSKVFREYRISARVYDYMENLIFHTTRLKETIIIKLSML